MLPNGVPECVTFLASCVGSFIRVVPSDYPRPTWVCETCGDVGAQKLRVVLVRADVERPVRYCDVNPASVGLSFRTIQLLDSMKEPFPYRVSIMVVPTGFDVDNIEPSWGEACV